MLQAPREGGGLVLLCKPVTKHLFQAVISMWMVERLVFVYSAYNEAFFTEKYKHVGVRGRCLSTAFAGAFVKGSYKHLGGGLGLVLLFTACTGTFVPGIYK